MMYSNGDCTNSSYNVQYSINSVSPTNATGWVFGQNNPILSSNTSNKVDGPGHHSVLQVGTNYYICYHRHDIWLTGGGLTRQTCLDPMTFTASDQINKVTPSHQGVGYIGANQNNYPNLARGAAVTVSSTEGTYYPKYATDDNNATLWRAADETLDQWVKIDLGSAQSVKRTHLQFEYPSYVYQYLIECSSDNSNWQVYSDKRGNQKPGCPMVDSKEVSARYFKITITNMEPVKNIGKRAGIFNFKAYSEIDPNFETLINQYVNADINPKLPPYTINANLGFGGSITPASANLWPDGSQTFTITPLAGYSVASVIVDGADAGAVTTYTFSNVNENHTITVRFKSGGQSGSIPQTSQLIFACLADTLPLSGAIANWPTLFPAGKSCTKMNNPSVKIIAGKKFVQNNATEADGFVFGSSYSSAIACAGASIVAVVAPVRTSNADAWNSVVDVFYDRLVLGVINNTGKVYSRRNGTAQTSTYAIPEKQVTILSMMVQPNGNYSVYANGTQIISTTSTSAMSSLVPGVGGDWQRFINVGRNNPDGWSTYNGNIGDVFLYKIALSDVERQQLEANIGNRLLTGEVTAIVPETRPVNRASGLIVRQTLPHGVAFIISKAVNHRIDIVALSGRVIRSFGGDRAAAYVLPRTSVAPGVYLVRAKVGAHVQTLRVAVE
ncbi:MAG: discoidin domain-containing protein [Chitinispirillaceae bacterium]|nr:discoidin domain-containing protein [Chitinispirillaceae bacterium]